MNKAARGLLYFFGAFFLVYGGIALFMPDTIAGQLIGVDGGMMIGR